MQNVLYVHLNFPNLILGYPLLLQRYMLLQDLKKSLPLSLQVPVTLLEYSMSAVTEGIDAIATTRVLIRGENNAVATHAGTGEQINRTFRYYNSFSPPLFLYFEQLSSSHFIKF